MSMISDIEGITRALMFITITTYGQIKSGCISNRKYNEIITNLKFIV